MTASSARTIAPRPFGPDRLRAALNANPRPWPGDRCVPRSVDGTMLQRTTAPPQGTTARQAAVLALFYPVREQLTLLLIQRPEYAGHHSGQIGLPGGSIEPTDASPLQAALREAQEEVGLDESELEVLGQLDPIYVHVSNFMVQAFAAWRPTRPRFRLDPVEVAGIVEVPLSALLDPATLQEEVWLLAGGQQIVPFFRVGELRIWGATARILDQLIWRIECSGEAEPA